MRLFPVTPRHTVFQCHRIDSQRIEPFCDLGTFLVPGKFTVSATGTNDNAGANGFFWIRRKIKYLRCIHIGNADYPIASRNRFGFFASIPAGSSGAFLGHTLKGLSSWAGLGSDCTDSTGRKRNATRMRRRQNIMQFSVSLMSEQGPVFNVVCQRAMP